MSLSNDLPRRPRFSFRSDSSSPSSSSSSSSLASNNFDPCPCFDDGCKCGSYSVESGSGELAAPPLNLDDHDTLPMSARSTSVAIAQATATALRSESTQWSSKQTASTRVSLGSPTSNSFKFHVRDYFGIDSKEGQVACPQFSCFGHTWRLFVCPSARHRHNSDSDEGGDNISIRLVHDFDEALLVTFKIQIMNREGAAVRERTATHFFESNNSGHWFEWNDIISHSTLVDTTKNILDPKGTLTVVVSFKGEEPDAYIPENSFPIKMCALFLEEDSSDVSFEVATYECKGKADGNEKKRLKTRAHFPCHYLVLKQCAPKLASLFNWPLHGGSSSVVTINDVCPTIFRCLLQYVYGGTIPASILANHANALGLIKAASKYSITGVKLVAEAALMKLVFPKEGVVVMGSGSDCRQNIIDYLIYAESNQLPLLKEAAVNFIAGSNAEAIQKLSFGTGNIPSNLAKDLLIAKRDHPHERAGSSQHQQHDQGLRNDDFKNMNVSELRRRIQKNGFKIKLDSSREEMERALREQEGKSSISAQSRNMASRTGDSNAYHSNH